MLKKFGADLKKIREKRGITLHDIANKTRIHITLLEKMEHGDFSFYSSTYIRAFLKQYSKITGLNPDEVLFKLMTMAHEQDITLNQLVNNILRDEMNKLDQEKRISINDLQKKKKIDKMIKAVEDGQTFIICEDDECLKPISVIMPIDKYNALKSM